MAGSGPTAGDVAACHYLNGGDFTAEIKAGGGQIAAFRNLALSVGKYGNAADDIDIKVSFSSLAHEFALLSDQFAAGIAASAQDQLNVQTDLDAADAACG